MQCNVHTTLVHATAQFIATRRVIDVRFKLASFTQNRMFERRRLRTSLRSNLNVEFLRRGVFQRANFVAYKLADCPRIVY